MTGDDLTCAELVNLVTEYLDGALSPAERARFDEHLMTCPACQAHLDQIRWTIDLFGRLPKEALSTDAERDLLDAFREWGKD
jgi:anti-sigma factor RsiW